MSDFKYEIMERLGVVSQSKGGWTRELNIVSFNDKDPRYDLRDWAPDRGSMSKGFTFSKEELIVLKDLLKAVS